MGGFFFGFRPKTLAMLFNKAYQNGLHIFEKTVQCASKNMLAN